MDIESARAELRNPPRGSLSLVSLLIEAFVLTSIAAITIIVLP